MSLTSNLRLTLAATLVGDLDLQTVRAALNEDKRIGLASGTGANQADLVWSDTRTLAASGSESLDLAGSLTDALGASLSFARVKVILISAAAGNTNNVVVGGASEDAFVGPFADATDKLVVRPGGMVAIAAPDATAYAVTASTADLLQVANSAGTTSVTYDVVIIGASA